MDDQAFHEAVKAALAAGQFDVRYDGAAWLKRLLDDHDKVRQEQWRDAILAAQLLQLLGDETFMLRLGDSHEIQRRIVERLVEVLDPLSLAPLEARLAAARALNHYGDPRPGVATLEPLWCQVPAGMYTVGTDTLHTVQLTAFQIAAYPVTNAQFGMFMAANGYTERRYWSELGWAWLQPQPEGQLMDAYPDADYPLEFVRTGLQRIDQPGFWQKALWNAPNQPVVGVSWYEALAYCAWLSEQLGYHIRLPSDAQWEVVARGPQRSLYPWGDVYDHAKVCAEYFEDYQGPHPVGCYPDGRSWIGAYDLAGNVMEWTCSIHDHANPSNRLDTNAHDFVSLRGGSWDSEPEYVQSGYREPASTYCRWSFHGFRVIREYP